jgi:hypothetical protein
MRKRGDLAEGDGVKRRIVELADGGGTVCIDVEDDVAEENGKGSVWTGRRESEERIWTTEDWIKDGRDDVFPTNSLVSLVGTEPVGNTENT